MIKIIQSPFEDSKKGLNNEEMLDGNDVSVNKKREN
jgi:hypothetical protein